MTDVLSLVASGSAGVLLGAFFFAGLWWTTKRSLTAAQPGLSFLVSSLVRTVALLTGFYLVAGDSAARLLACMFGFAFANLGARILGLRRHTARPATQPEARDAR